jgi:hypothetical protein
MGDINNGHDDVAARATFSIAMYVIILSYLIALLVPCLNLIHVLSLMYMDMYASATVMLF